jgi:hypothetical protein
MQPVIIAGWLHRDVSCLSLALVFSVVCVAWHCVFSFMSSPCATDPAQLRFINASDMLQVQVMSFGHSNGSVGN